MSKETRCHRTKKGTNEQGNKSLSKTKKSERLQQTKEQKQQNQKKVWTSKRVQSKGKEAREKKPNL